MKKSVIALLLTIVLGVKGAGAVPVLAAETTAEEAAVSQEEILEDRNEPMNDGEERTMSLNFRSKSMLKRSFIVAKISHLP